VRRAGSAAKKAPPGARSSAGRCAHLGREIPRDEVLPLSQVATQDARHLESQAGGAARHRVLGFGGGRAERSGTACGARRAPPAWGGYGRAHLLWGQADQLLTADALRPAERRQRGGRRGEARHRQRRKGGGGGGGGQRQKVPPPHCRRHLCASSKAAACRGAVDRRIGQASQDWRRIGAGLANPARGWPGQSCSGSARGGEERRGNRHWNATSSRARLLEAFSETHWWWEDFSCQPARPAARPASALAQKRDGAIRVRFASFALRSRLDVDIRSHQRRPGRRRAIWSTRTTSDMRRVAPTGKVLPRTRRRRCPAYEAPSKRPARLPATRACSRPSCWGWSRRCPMGSARWPCTARCPRRTPGWGGTRVVSPCCVTSGERRSAPAALPLRSPAPRRSTGRLRIPDGCPGRPLPNGSIGTGPAPATPWTSTCRPTWSRRTWRRRCPPWHSAQRPPRRRRPPAPAARRPGAKRRCCCLSTEACGPAGLGGTTLPWPRGSLRRGWSP
jgi:hypothetical protein